MKTYFKHSGYEDAFKVFRLPSSPHAACGFVLPGEVSLLL